MEDKELLIRQIVLIEEMGKKVNAIEGAVTMMKDGHVVQTQSRLAVSEEKISRLEKIIYGSIATIIVQGFAILILWLQKK